MTPLSPNGRSRARIPPGRRGWFAAGLALFVLFWPGAQPLPAIGPTPPVYKPDPVPPALTQSFTEKKFKLDQASGNYLAPKVHGKTLPEPMQPVLIDGKFVKDLRGKTVFLRQTIRDRLQSADQAMFKARGEHIQINYGFRSNALQYELFQKLNGKAKVAAAGSSFHETGMALDINNWQHAQRYMIEAGFVGGCFGIEEDLVHYSVGEITKASNFEAFKRCSLKEIPDQILQLSKKMGDVDGMKKVGTAGMDGVKKVGGLFGKIKKKD